MSLLGWIFGIAAALALAVVMAYSARRAVPQVRKLGPTRKYLQLHLWGGGAFLILFLLHTSFGLPAGAMPLALWIFSVWVVLTGAIGVLLQKSVPRILEPATTFEAHLQRLPAFADELRARAEAEAAKADPRVKAYYDQQLAPDMVAPRMIAGVLLRNPRNARRGIGDVDILKRTLTPEGIGSLDLLRELHTTKHEIDVHYTMQRIMRGWLWLHLPVAVALCILVLLHVFFVIYF